MAGGRVMLGEVHDENAYAVGGVSGHAGLFSTAEDLARFCRAFMGGKIVKASTVDEMTRLGQVAVRPSQGLGWWLDSWTGDSWSGTSLGCLPSRGAAGMSGWTGTAVWMDRERGLFTILLGNTCHPSREGRHNDEFRRTFHMAVAKQFYGRPYPAHSGLDRLVYHDFEPLRGKRVGLLTHRAAVDQLGRHILDVFALAPDVKVATIFSPEHGLWGTAEAGEKVASEQGKVPVVSLYGDRTAPTAEELRGLDYLVVDLQDVGARYYTYIATMKACMGACAKARVPVMVLDRPNPLGGVVLEGPIAKDTTANVCCAPIPVRHGMTLGEMALYFKNTAFVGTNLQVVVNGADGWPRENLFNETSLPWVPPSPNMPTPETALIYVGTCLFEGTNLNEGRGTDTPFQRIGAPWLNAKKVLKRVREEAARGCRLEAVTYTPKAIPGKAASPVYKDEACEGIAIAVEKPLEVRAFTLALALLQAIRQEHPDKFEWKKNFDVLAGGDALRKRLEAGETAEAIVASYEEGLRAFAQGRPLKYE